jgi:outer membrane protein OmpA-like peptidoglycan-associated protein
MKRPLHGVGYLFLSSASLLMALALPGCLATQSWVQQQMSPVVERVSDVEGRLGQSEARLQQIGGKADVALNRLDHLRLERRLVLNLKDGAQFAFDSTAMTEAARRQIDRFVDEFGANREALFVVVGHTDNVGSEDYNFELGQKRATGVARYLISRKGIAPIRVMAVSCGASAPLADNMNSEGRRKNRRIEILVYQESISSSPGKQRLDLVPAG